MAEELGGSEIIWQGPEAMESLCVFLLNEMEYSFLSEELGQHNRISELEASVEYLKNIL